MSSDKINFASRKNLPLVDIVSVREINRGESQPFLLLAPSLSLLSLSPERLAIKAS